MANPKSSRPASAALAVLICLVLVACGDGDAELSRADVEQIVRSELADAPASPEPEPGLTSGDVGEAIRAAVAEMPQPQVGLSQEEVERIVQTAVASLPEPESGLSAAEAERIARGVVASIPPKSAPAEYTRFVVDSAIGRYETTGLDATLAYYNHQDSIDGQWYVFIIDSDDTVIGHYDPERRGLDLNGWVGTDANGYTFGPEMLTVTEDGKWVSYVYRNPETGDIGSEDFGDLQLKNAWVVRHDGMLFGSGWYIDADEHTKSLVAVAVDKFRTAGLAGTIEYFASPQSATAGLEETIAYYNNAESIEGQWLAFIADTDGRIVAHPDPKMLGTNLQDLFGAAASRATSDGNWVTTDDIDSATGGPESMRVWMVTHDGMTFGAGWYNAGTD